MDGRENLHGLDGKAESEAKSASPLSADATKCKSFENK